MFHEEKEKNAYHLTLSLPLPYTHYLSLSHLLTPTMHTQTFFVSFTLPRSHTRTPKHTGTHSTDTHTHTRTHAHKHTRAHSTHTRTHSYQQFLFKMQHQRKKLSTGKKDNRVGKLVLTKKKKRLKDERRRIGAKIFFAQSKTRKIIF